MKLSSAYIKEAINSGTWEAYKGEKRLLSSDLHIGPNSVDVTLHRKLLITTSHHPFDPANGGPEWTAVYCDGPEGFRLTPDIFVLGAVNERFVCHEPLAIRHAMCTGDVKYIRGYDYRRAYFTTMYEGRSTIARCGVMSHLSAGFGDYSFQGAYTLELRNVSNNDFILRAGMRIGQVAFEEVSEPDWDERYTGAYSESNHHDGPVPPALGKGRA